MKARHFLLACCIIMCTQPLAAQQTDSNKTKWLSHTDTAFRFTLQYPSDWEFKLPGTGTRFFITSYNENDSDNFRENINCIARNLDKKDFSVKAAEDAIKKSVSEKMNDYLMLSSGYLKWNNTDALYLDYTCTSTSGDKTYALHIYQQIAVVKGVLFTLTFTAEKDTYSKYTPTVKKVMQSLKIY